MYHVTLNIKIGLYARKWTICLRTIEKGRIGQFPNNTLIDLFPIHLWEKYSIFQGGALHEQFRSCGGIFGGIGGAACLKLDQLFPFVSGNMMMMVIILMVIKMVVFTTFKDLFRDTSLDYIWRAQIPAQICQIWPNMQICQIWPHMVKWGVPEKILLKAVQSRWS